jgi:phosphohistidine phosphatase
MKSLYLVRHAKSSWDDASVADFDRPLNERGKHDAPVMAERLRERKKNIDVFVSSPAKRAIKTCRIFTEEYEVKESKIITINELYLASAETFYNVMAQLSNDHKHMALFSHNPGITDFANTLCEEVHIDNMPTCSIFAVEAAIKKWEDFRSAKKRFLFFDYPKLVHNK